MWPSGHMVVVNLVDPKIMAEIPASSLESLFEKCHAAFSPLLGEWFELKRIACLCYIERSLNEGCVVEAPLPGEQPKAFPTSSESAQALLGGIFVSNSCGDVLIDIEKFRARCKDKATGQWLSFGAEVREMA